MAEGLNKVMLIGNVGQEPELRYTQTGQAVMSLRIATNERMKIRDEWQDRTEWHSVVIWGNRAEGLSKVLKKGSSLFIEGRLQTRSWKDRQDNTRYTTEIVAKQVLFMGRKNDSNDSSYNNRNSSRNDSRNDSRGDSRGDSGYSDYNGSNQYNGPDEFSDDDIPF